jgi:MoxR-like ATPase
MDLKILRDTPPWDWPTSAGTMFLKLLTDRQANPSDRLIAAELAGDFVVINDDLAHALLTVLGNPDEPEELRAKAAISFGPALEQASIDEFDDPDDVPITEEMFHKIQDSLRSVYTDPKTPKEVRRRILEASVRAPELWHQDAIRDAYASEDKDWILAAVFSMRWVRGFDEQILAELKSTDLEILRQAVNAAGNWALAAAWSPIVKFIHDSRTPKPLLLAAIGAVAAIRPAEAPEALEDLADSNDEEIAEAVEEVLSMAGPGLDGEEEEDEDDEEDEWVN